MKLRSIYSNRPGVFAPIEFQSGLNVVLGEIRLPENRSRSVHNLGKTTLARLIDFCLCKGSQDSFFLNRHKALFREFVFFIEIETLDGNFITVRRSVEEQSKASILLSSTSRKNCEVLNDAEWNHVNVPLKRAKMIIDGLLNLSAVKPWDFRMPVSYSLRTQSDFADVFRLSKFRGKHEQWKPYLSHILGLNASLINANIEVDREVDQLKESIANLRRDLGTDGADLDQIRGLIEIQKRDVADLEQAITLFDFEIEDKQINRSLVEQLDEEISELNEKRYLLSRRQKRLMDSLKAKQILFSTEAAEKLFAEAGSVFPEQLKKTYDDLIRFNKEISQERVDYLKDELLEVNAELETVSGRLAVANRTRQKELAVLRDSESLSKYRGLNERLVELKNQAAILTRHRDALVLIEQHERQLRALRRKREEQTDLLREDLNKKSEDSQSRYATVRSGLARICDAFLGHKALLNSRVNKEGNIEFHAEYLDPSDKATSEDEGKSYRQLLCAGFDLSVMEALLDEEYIRFVYHDGLLEGLDDRIKLNVIAELRNLAEKGIQQILTVIDSDLPINVDGERFQFSSDEVVCRLHDEGINGRLFRMEPW